MMKHGVIDTSALAGGLDLQSTVESGQSYLWNRVDGQMYDEDETEQRDSDNHTANTRGGAYGGDAWYWTTVRPDGRTQPAVIRVRQTDEQLEWESHIDAEPYLQERLRLDDNLDMIMAETPDDRLIRDAYETYRGMRLVCDPPFGALISFICSAQMRVSRIYAMQQALRREFGEPVEFDGTTYHAYPTPATLADATESQLRDLGLGYRAPYVQRSAEMVASGDADPADAAGRPYEEARAFCTQFVGVGEKVADCILLFSLGYLEAVPLDTWIKTTIEQHYPECAKGSYEATSRAIREAFGGEYAGYAQTYVFHYLRNGGE